MIIENIDQKRGIFRFLAENIEEERLLWMCVIDVPFGGKIPISKIYRGKESPHLHLKHYDDKIFLKRKIHLVNKNLMEDKSTNKKIVDQIFESIGRVEKNHGFVFLINQKIGHKTEKRLLDITVTTQKKVATKYYLGLKIKDKGTEIFPDIVNTARELSSRNPVVSPTKPPKQIIGERDIFFRLGVVVSMEHNPYDSKK